jgi:hypothetical protein
LINPVPVDPTIVLLPISNTSILSPKIAIGGSGAPQVTATTSP